MIISAALPGLQALDWIHNELFREKLKSLAIVLNIEINSGE